MFKKVKVVARILVLVHKVTCSNVWYGIHTDTVASANRSVPILSMQNYLEIFVLGAQPCLGEPDAFKYCQSVRVPVGAFSKWCHNHGMVPRSLIS